MIFTIVYDETGPLFADFDVHYNIVATGGPPDEPLFDIKLTGYSFIEAYKFIDFETVAVINDCRGPEAVARYYEMDFDKIRTECRKFELTKNE
jgi:hypothetical protein